MFIGAPFGKSPQLAAITATFFAILLAIVALVLKGGPTLSLVYTLIFPPGFFVFAIVALCGYERRDTSPILGESEPDHGTRLGALFVVAAIDIFLYPLLAAWVESIRYDAKQPGKGLFSFFRRRVTPPLHPEGAALCVRNLRKTFPAAGLFKWGRVTAIEDLSFTIPKTGIWILLGRLSHPYLTLIQYSLGYRCQRCRKEHCAFYLGKSLGS
jgi:ATP-binding cassette subfamily A (ABC1) protein 3